MPPPLVQRFRSLVPDGQRSKFVADLIAKKLQSKSSAIEQAARKANTLAQVNRDMKDWEALNQDED
ncbi:MAG TPA: hypothetical protein VK633_13710 [Verrucomicrobiae bacterium]|nr:hypothetical protein [Verrucomicrobiae bacterium]